MNIARKRQTDSLRGLALTAVVVASRTATVMTNTTQHNTTRERPDYVGTGYTLGTLQRARHRTGSTRLHESIHVNRTLQ